MAFETTTPPTVTGASRARLALLHAEWALAAQQPGFLSFKSYAADDGEVVAISEWADAASASAWGAHPAHRVVQGRGRGEYYAEYTSISADQPRVRRFSMDDPA